MCASGCTFIGLQGPVGPPGLRGEKGDTVSATRLAALGVQSPMIV